MPPYKSTGTARRSYDSLKLVTSKTINKYGDRCFQVASPRFWNELPFSIRQSSSINCFKKDLKTFLFPLNVHSILYKI